MEIKRARIISVGIGQAGVLTVEGRRDPDNLKY